MLQIALSISVFFLANFKVKRSPKLVCAIVLEMSDFVPEKKLVCIQIDKNQRVQLTFFWRRNQQAIPEYWPTFIQ